MAREGHVMFWGGEYTRQLYVAQARRVGHANAMLVHNDRLDAKKNADNPNLPYFDYAVVSGCALKSRLNINKYMFCYALFIYYIW